MATAQKISPKLWLWWTLATIAGSALSWLAIWVVPGWPSAVLYGVGGIGVGVAVLQAVVLRGRLRHAAWWALATSVVVASTGIASIQVNTAVFGDTLDLGADATLTLGSGSYLLIELPPLAGGFLLGACQWLVVRRSFRRAGWWIPVTGLSLVVGRFTGFVASNRAFDLPDPEPSVAHLFALIVTALIFGAATGYTLRRLGRSPAP